MEKKDVRIGNLVYAFKGVWEIDSTDFSGEQISTYKPIPLTEDWLIKFGFELKGESRYGRKFIMQIAHWWFIVENSFKKETWFFGHEYYDSGDDNLDFKSLRFCYNLKYVHQLQNLIYALTGEDLI